MPPTLQVGMRHALNEAFRTLNVPNAFFGTSPMPGSV